MLSPPGGRQQAITLLSRHQARDNTVIAHPQGAITLLSRHTPRDNTEFCYRPRPRAITRPRPLQGFFKYFAEIMSRIAIGRARRLSSHFERWGNTGSGPTRSEQPFRTPIGSGTLKYEPFLNDTSLRHNVEKPSNLKPFSKAQKSPKLMTKK